MKFMHILLSIFFIVLLSTICDAKSYNKKNNSTIKPGTIVLLNGTSSAGKSTTLHALHAIYDTFEIEGIDTYTRIHQNGSREQKFKGFYTEIKEISLAGHNVLVDTIAFEEEYEKNIAFLQPSPLIKILVYCPIHMIIAHVLQRNKCGDIRERRNFRQAFTGFINLYKIQNSMHDIIIDKINSLSMQKDLQKAQSIADTWTWSQARRQRKVNKRIRNIFNLEKPREFSIAPKHKWDFIVNTGIDTPEIVARKIADFIDTNYTIS